MVAYGRDYHRAQILLEKEQHEALQRIAEDDRRSLSELMREIVRAYLAKSERERQLERDLAVLDELDKIRERGAARYGVYEGDLIAEIRAERDAQFDEVMRGAKEK